MRVGIYSPYLESLGGGERYMLTIAEYLGGKHRVEIFWDDKSIVKKARQRLEINLNRTQIVNNIFSRPQFVLKKWLLSRQYDLIIFLSDGSVPFSLAKKNILHFQRPFSQVRGRSFLNRIKLSRFQTVICNSKFTKKYIDETYGINSLVIYPPVAVKEFSPLSKENVILSVGRFHPLKKQQQMIDFFAKLTQKLPGWQLVLVGGVLFQDRDYFHKLKQKIRRLDIKLLPNLDFDRLKEFYGKAKIYWHAAGFGEDEEENPAGMEHFGISTVEAMAASCVPVVYNGGGQREIVEHGIDGFLWRREKELLDYTLKLAENEDLRREMTKKAVRKSKNFSKERFCQEVNKLLKQFKLLK